MTFGIDPQQILVSFGLLGAYGILFAESGLLIGFFLPGDSLIFTAGLVASQGYFSLAAFMIGGTLSAILGNELGYYLGRKFGHRIFNKEKSLLFDKQHVARAENFYATKGPFTIILARFIPIIRTFVPILAGVGKMEHRKFTLYNILGAVAWVPSVSLLGYFLGRHIKNVDHYILPIIIAVIVLSVVPGLFQLLRKKSSA